MTKLDNITIYSTKELADMLNVTPTTIGNYIRSGDLEGKKFLGRWYITEEELKKKLLPYEEVNKSK
jgi:predicted site-specific integrase-resolvase